MNPFDPVIRVFAGWGDILSGKPSWRERFDLTGRGIVLALAAYFLVYLLILMVQSGLAGRLPSLPEVILSFALAGGRVVALGLAIVLTRVTLRFEAPVAALLVPSIYALAMLLVLQLLLSLFGTQLASALYGAIGYMLYRVARVTAGLGIGPSVAFAALSLVLLVGLPLGLYMLLQSGTGPI